MVAGFISDNPTTTQDDISDYVASNVKDPISRLNGVGDVQLFGAQYAMRVWLDGNLLNKYNLTPVDVINALQVQNDQIAAGQLGGTPALKGQQLNASIIAQTRLKDPQEFGKVTLRVNADGSVVHLKDVARIELGERTITSSPELTVNLPLVWVLSLRPAPTPWIPPPRLKRSWTSCSPTSSGDEGGLSV